jgi:enoyl-CoA hydratase/carnithine racemase
LSISGKVTLACTFYDGLAAVQNIRIIMLSAKLGLGKNTAKIIYVLVPVVLIALLLVKHGTFSLQVLRELKDALIQLKRDEGCRVVLLSSTGPSFCQGIDVHSLIHANPDKRKRAAQELSQALK